jgi:biofilm protein TabA
MIPHHVHSQTERKNMIHDTFDHAGLYDGCCENFHRAVELARKLSPDTPKGKIEIDDEAMYAMVNIYITKSPEEASFEAHRKYIDVQILLAGRERIDVTQRTDLPVLQSYAEDADAMLYAAPAAFTSVLLEPGQFVVLFPHDAHRPGVSLGAKTEVRKLVVKIRV